MSQPVSIQIVGAPAGVCGGEIKDAWRDAADMIAARLRCTFGEQIDVHYFDLLDPACPELPPDAQLPLVLVDGKVFSSGGKLSSPALRRYLESMGIAQISAT